MKAQGDLAARIIEELSRHAAIEEQLFYPAVRETFPDDAEYVLEALEEHHAAKSLLAEIDRLSPTHERFRAKLMVLIESVERHIEEEELTVFPELRRAMGRKQLAELGRALEAAKATAPTTPHPHLPDEPPLQPWSAWPREWSIWLVRRGRARSSASAVSGRTPFVPRRCLWCRAEGRWGTTRVRRLTRPDSPALARATRAIVLSRGDTVQLHGSTTWRWPPDSRGDAR
jgi:hemerythrin-like domain-containing protein